MSRAKKELLKHLGIEDGYEVDCPRCAALQKGKRKPLMELRKRCEECIRGEETTRLLGRAFTSARRIGHDAGYKSAAKRLRELGEDITTEDIKERLLKIRTLREATDCLLSPSRRGGTRRVNEAVLSHPTLVARTAEILRGRGFREVKSNNLGCLLSGEFQRMEHIRWMEPFDQSDADDPKGNDVSTGKPNLNSTKRRALKVASK